MDIFIGSADIYRLKRGELMQQPNFAFLPKLDEASAWRGVDLQKSEDLWTYELSEADVQELENAASEFLLSNRPLGQISPKDFVLNRLVRILKDTQRHLKDGIGFRVITGLPTSSYSAEFAATIFCGIGSYIGLARSQNAAGHLLGHVRDTGADVRSTKVRVYQTNARQTFHTDSADVVGLLCLREAKVGGDSMLASSLTALKEIVNNRPELVKALFEPVAYDRRGEVAEGQDPFLSIPVYNWYEGFLSCIYHRTYINSAQRYKKAPKLTECQVEALNELDRILEDPSIHLKMRLKPGDMQFVYNHCLLHDRTEFVDWEDAEKKRHLLRLWLSLPEDRPLPPVYEQRYGDLTVGNRGGILTEKTVLKAPVFD